MSTGMERREHERVELQGIVADLADEGNVFDGMVEDISTTGFRMSGIQKRFAPKAKDYVTIMAINKKNFKFLVRPCWKKPDPGGLSMELGFKIVNIPWSWTEMVENMLPEQEDVDIWGSYN